MLECFVCHCVVAKTLQQYFKHLKTKHGRFHQYDTYCCSQGQCCRTFSYKYTFTRHLRKEHSSDIAISKQVVSSSAACKPMEEKTQCESIETEIDQDLANACETTTSVTNSENVDVKDDGIKQLAIRFIAEAKSCISTLSTVHRVMTACQQLVESIIDNAIDILQSADINSPDVHNKLNGLRNPFEEIETEYAQSTYLERIGVFVKPESYVVGSRQAFVTDKDSMLNKPVMETVTAQYVPITNMLVALNDKTNLIKQALSNNERMRNGCYQSFFDGSVWADHPLKEENVLVLRLYGDDFEPGNPLGSRKTIYKTGTIMYQLENLPSQLLSHTENIFLALCYHTDDMKEFGWESILRPLVNELRQLESSGISLAVDGKTVLVRVIIGVFTGDNLFLNGITGFVESFTAHKPCRLCTVDRSEFSEVLVENQAALRTVKSYDSAVANINVQDTGIKQKCVFNDLTYFHAVVNCTQDIMHDIFEGVLCYDLLLICHALVSSDYLSLKQLNHRIQTFNYGYHDVRNRPPLIPLTADTLPFDACQAWCLMRILAVAVGDLVPDDDTVWQFYLCLRDVMDIVLAPNVSQQQVAVLPVLVNEYLEQRLVLFPDNTLKNKHHHLTHYATLICRFGPLVRYSCMRFESKHQRIKKILHIAGNFKNVPKSCAYRHQHDVAFRLLQSRSYEHSDLVIGTGSVTMLSELRNGLDINQALGNVGLFSELYDAAWIQISGIKYIPSCVVLSGIDSENKPTFVEVSHILVYNNGSSRHRMWLVGEKLHTEYFNIHFHAWSVKKQFPVETASVDPRALIYCTPLLVHSQMYSDEKVYLISLRYHV